MVLTQAVKAGTTVYLSGQIPLVAETMEMVSDDFKRKLYKFLRTLKRCDAGGGTKTT